MSTHASVSAESADHRGESQADWGLVIDSGAAAGAEVAVIHAGRIVAADRLPAGERSARGLVPLVDRMLRSIAVTPRQLVWAAVTIGPGSFTGLRVGITFAKMLAFGAGIRLIAIESFAPYERRHRELVASGAIREGRFWTVADAQRRQYFVRSQWLSRHDATEESRSDDSVSETLQIVDPTAWLETLGPNDRIGGPIAERLDAAVLEARGVQRLSPEQTRFPLDSMIAIAIEQAAAGRFVTAQKLQPLYGRASAAEEKRGGEPGGEPRRHEETKE